MQFWVVPSLCVVVSIAAAIGMVSVDKTVGQIHASFLYPGGASGARLFLSSIVTSMIAVTGTVFSVSIVALQLANGQFSSRVIRVYLRDLIVQVTLGLFMATFVYSMVVLRSVGGTAQAASSFVPRIAITGAFALVIASVGMFISYISHISDMLRVATLVVRIGQESRHLLEQRYPIDAERQARRPELPPELGHIASKRPGVVVSVNERRLVDIAADAGCILRLVPRVGDFVAVRAPLLSVHSDDTAVLVGEKWDSLAERAVRAVVQDTERTMEQDLAFGFRQLVDVAEKALSPALNDPTTATQCLDALHDLLRRLASRPLPAGVHFDGNGDLRLVVPQYGFGDFLDVALTEIWCYGRGAPQIPPRISVLLDDLASAAIDDHGAHVERWRERVAASE